MFRWCSKLRLQPHIFYPRIPSPELMADHTRQFRAKNNKNIETDPFQFSSPDSEEALTFNKSRPHLIFLHNLFSSTCLYCDFGFSLFIGRTNASIIFFAQAPFTT